MTITEEDFQKLCDSFQEELGSLEGDSLNEGTVLTLGNITWKVHLFPEQTLEYPKEPLIQLFSNRRDLVREVVQSSGIRSYIKGAYRLAVWLEERGYQVGLDANGFFPRLKLNLFNAYVGVVHFFNPH